MYNAIKHINNMIIEDRRVVFSLDTLSCIEESFNFGIDVYIESSATIKYSAFNVDSLEEVDFGYEIYTYNEEAATILAQAEAIQNGFSYELISVTKIEKNYEVC